VRPHVIVHNAVSANGMLTGFEVDMGLYYRLAGTLGCQADLVGSGTILAAPESRQHDDPGEQYPAGRGSGSLLVIPDSRGAVRCWGFLQRSGFWGGFVSIVTDATPDEHIAYLRRRGIEVVHAGAERVDLPEMLARLAERFGVERVRTDSGGRLNGALLAAGLVDELSLLVTPVVSTGLSAVPLFAGDTGVFALTLTHEERFGGGQVWLRYDVVR
jgi:2,5-diamino-6-(ribosylamino)-4(3H)-pyrimidinone 5'-phosphate reductase